MIFIILFFIIPLVEIALFMQIGGVIGVGYTLLLCAVTAVIGGALCRYQGLQAWRDFQNHQRDAARQSGAGLNMDINLGQGQMVLTDIIHGMGILMAGMLLMTPGFATDMVGFLLFIPALRRMIGEFALASFGLPADILSSPSPKNNSNHNDVSDDITGEYVRMDIDSPNQPPQR